MHNTLKSHYYPSLIGAGYDEAGRGCSAGSVFAVTVILPSNYDSADLNDSKQLSCKKHGALCQAVINDIVVQAMGEITPQEIGGINILRTSFLTMHHALDQLITRPQTVIMDGNRFAPHHDPFCTIVIKGSGKYQDIVTASILTKTFRDDYMDRLAQEYPQYG